MGTKQKKTEPLKTSADPKDTETLGISAEPEKTDTSKIGAKLNGSKAPKVGAAPKKAKASTRVRGRPPVSTTLISTSKLPYHYFNEANNHAPRA